LGWKKELHAGPRFISVASERDSYYKEKYSEFVDQLRLLSGKTGTVFALVTWLPDSSSPDVYAHDSLREIFTDHSFLQRCVERVTDYNQLARQAERTGVSSFVELGLTHGEAQALATAIMDRLKRGLKWADYNLDLPWVKAAEPQLSFAAKLDELGVPYASPLTLRASDITAAGESKVKSLWLSCSAFPSCNYALPSCRHVIPRNLGLQFGTALLQVLVLLDMLASHPAECPTSTIKLALVTSGFRCARSHPTDCRDSFGATISRGLAVLQTRHCRACSSQRWLARRGCLPWGALANNWPTLCAVRSWASQQQLRLW
jgi:hypothetical protein